MTVAGRFVAGALFLLWVVYESEQRLRADRFATDEFRALMPDEEWAEIERRALSAA